MTNNNAKGLPKTSEPATRALHDIGIKNLDQLAGMSAKKLLSLHGFGPKALRIIKEELAKSNKSLSD